MKHSTKPMIIILSLSLLFNIVTTTQAQAQLKWFVKKDKAEVNSVESPVESYIGTTEIETPDEMKTRLKTPVEKKTSSWSIKKPDMSDYLMPIPEDTGYHQVNNFIGDSGKIQGSVSEDVMQLSLADCLEMAVVNNPKIASAKAMSDAYDTRKLQAISNYTPNLNLTSGVSRMKPDTGTSRAGNDAFSQYLVGQIGISQLIYDFGQTQNLYALQKAAHSDSLTNIADQINLLVYQVKDAYYYLLLTMERVRVMEESVDYFQVTYNQAKAFWQVGTRAKIDVTIAEVNLANARADLIQAKGEVEVAIATLNNAMGLPYVPSYQVSERLPFEKTNINMAEAVETANKFRPGIERASLLVNVQDQALRLQRKSFYPTLGFNANWARGTVQGEDQRGWWDAGVYLGFPTVNPVLVKAQVDEAKYNLVRQQYDSKTIVYDVYYDIQSAFERVRYMQDRVPAAGVAVKKAWETFELASGRYKVGEGDAIELKDAQLQYQNSRLSYFATLYQFNNAKSNLERAIGKSVSGNDVLQNAGI